MRRGRIVKSTTNKYPHQGVIAMWTDDLIRFNMNKTVTQRDGDNKGFKGKSCIMRLQGFNLVKNVSMDWMHLLFLGVTRKQFGNETLIVP